MDKNNFPNTDYIIEDMYHSISIAPNGYVDFDSYSDIIGQNILVLLHSPSTYANYHTHNCFEINYVHHGSCINLVENELYFMEQGELIILHPGTYHNLYSPKESRIFNFLIRQDWFYKVLNQHNLEHSPVSTFIKNSQKKDYYKFILCSRPITESRTPSKVQKLASRLIKESQSADLTHFLLMEAIAIELFCTLISQCNTAFLSQKNLSNSKTITAFLSYIVEHYNKISLDEFSVHSGYSKTHICRLFKQHLGKSFLDVVTELRINYAKSYLTNTDMLVKDICFEVGYDSIEYFQRLFKRKTGYTPGEYRNLSKKA